MLVLTFLCIGASAVVAAPAVERYAVPGHGDLLLAVPAEWQAVYVRDDATPPTVYFTPVEESGEDFQLTLTVYRHEGYDRNPASSESVRALVASVAEEVKAFGSGADPDIRAIEGIEGPAFAFSLLDPGSEDRADAYPALTQGALAIGELVIVFTLLGPDDGGALRTALYAMLRSARLERLARDI